MNLEQQLMELKSLLLNVEKEKQVCYEFDVLTFFFFLKTCKENEVALVMVARRLET